MLPENNRQTKAILSRDVALEHLLDTCLGSACAFALYRLPGSDSAHLVIDLSASVHIGDPEIEEMEPGFLFAPFNDERHETRHIRAHIQATVQDNKCRLQINPRLQPESSPQLDNFMRTLNEHTHSGSPYYTLQDPQIDTGNTTEEDFVRLVEKAKNAIGKGRFQKVVPARARSTALSHEFSPVDLFKKLTRAYSNAMVYLVSSPGTGTWMGATPELLISIDKDQVFSTSALAGTQPYRKDTPLDDAAWKQKEIEEQAMVSRYIINCFKRIRLREFDEIGPRTVKAGNVIHLETRYNVNMRDVQYPQLGSVMLGLLHPTSAVCGMPKDTSMDFLRLHEPFDRAYFSGYLGPVHIDNEIRLFVNLRCMQLLPGNKAILYSGAGVTEHSDPRKEWVETNLKMKTLEDLMGKNGR